MTAPTRPIPPAAGNAGPWRAIIVCADDYGLDARIDEAVRQLAAHGRLSATSCMSTAPRWPEAAAALRSLRPALSAGLHFNLTESHGGSGAAWPLPRLIAAACLRRLPQAGLRAAWRQQLDAFEQALGTPPDYIDGHQHVHQLPGVRDALLAELDQRYSAHERPWVRSTAPAPGLWREPKVAVIALLGGWRLARLLRRAGIASNAGFAGVYGFDASDEAAYGRLATRWLQRLGDGGLLMCHPAAGVVEGDAIGRQRPIEHAYLRSPAFAQALHDAGCRVHRGPWRPAAAAP